ncbi:Os12g0169600 [Oryza sativa Japonica Group]|uniref:Os12g0169600 protein n=1 Tax=Oryza sativa subsp. japonica TaxID=39947 RepID=C7JA37_ORYSJ|nr:Os12g0169600 [Oryza sativa Japonica Group]|eukprot:NP_001176808.1 Os12g0169600 [Oryza sativa Japonica Group]
MKRWARQSWFEASPLLITTFDIRFFPNIRVFFVLVLGITLKTESLWINLKRWRRRGGGSWRWTSRTRRAGRGWRRSEQAGVQDAAGDGAGAGAVHLGGHPVRGDAVPVHRRRPEDRRRPRRARDRARDQRRQGPRPAGRVRSRVFGARGSTASRHARPPTTSRVPASSSGAPSSPSPMPAPPPSPSRRLPRASPATPPSPRSVISCTDQFNPKNLNINRPTK